MGLGAKHGTDFNCFSKRKVSFCNKVVFCFGRQSGRQTGILPKGKAAEVYQGHKMRLGFPRY
ncbi:MAG TPA: hypothetical protein VFB55_00275, partial [Verrucomicrobiae bacterium]|nr:hypothetical protein [Verrucomicrobiae bacterium]